MVLSFGIRICLPPDTLPLNVAGMVTATYFEAWTVAEPEAWTVTESKARTVAKSRAWTVAEPKAWTVAKSRA